MKEAFDSSGTITWQLCTHKELSSHFKASRQLGAILFSLFQKKTTRNYWSLGNGLGGMTFESLLDLETSFEPLWHKAIM